MSFLVFLGPLISFLFALPYLRATLQGRIQPNKLSWFLWSVAPLISFFAALMAGVGLAAVPVLASGLVTLMIFLASFVNKAAYWEIRPFDWICGAVSLLALVFWFLTKNPDLAIALSILADFMAALPTLYKAWRYPETEHVAPYLSGILSPATVFFALTSWNFAGLAFPFYLMGLNIVFTLIILKRNKKKKLNSSNLSKEAKR